MNQLNLLFIFKKPSIFIKQLSKEACICKQEGKKFEQHSTLTIPHELFVGSKGSIDLVVVNIAWDQKKNINRTRSIGFRRIYHRYIDEDTFRLY